MLGKRLVQSALVFVVAGAMVMVWQTSALAQAYGPYYLVDYFSHSCVDNPNSSPRDNTAIIIYQCGNGTNQRWVNEDQPGPGQYWIKNQVSGKCLTVQNAVMWNNAPVIQYTCNAGANEVWYYDYQGYNYDIGTRVGTKPGGVYKIRNQKSGRCLTVINNQIANGATLVQFDCDKDGSNLFVESVA